MFTWLSRGSYGFFVAVTVPTWLLRGLCFDIFRENRLRGSYGTDLCDSVTVALSYRNTNYQRKYNEEVRNALYDFVFFFFFFLQTLP